MADKPYVEVERHCQIECTAHRVMDPACAIPKNASTKKREKNDIGCATSCVQHGRPKRGLIGSLQDEPCKRGPMVGVVLAIADRQGRAEGL